MNGIPITYGATLRLDPCPWKIVVAHGCDNPESAAYVAMTYMYERLIPFSKNDEGEGEVELLVLDPQTGNEYEETNHERAEFAYGLIRAGAIEDPTEDGNEDG